MAGIVDENAISEKGFLPKMHKTIFNKVHIKFKSFQDTKCGINCKKLCHTAVY